MSANRIIQLLIGAGGIYGAFLYYGTLQEDVFKYVSEDGTKFKSAWFLQCVETLANVLVAIIGRALLGGIPNLPMLLFGFSGVAQVSAKAFTNLALVNGVSFPIVTLAKAGKSFPVMIASLIVGTCLVSSGSHQASKSSTVLGLVFIVLSLLCDGFTGGIQQRMKKDLQAKGLQPLPYDFMLFTNFFMMITAVIVAVILGDFQTGLAFCLANTAIFVKILKFAGCSAIGQTFIFYTISTFDPYICSTITTTRKMFSVLLSIFLNGYQLSMVGWGGIALSSIGILMELSKEAGKTSHAKKSDASDDINPSSDISSSNKGVDAHGSREEPASDPMNNNKTVRKRK